MQLWIHFPSPVQWEKQLQDHDESLCLWWWLKPIHAPSSLAKEGHLLCPGGQLCLPASQLARYWVMQQLPGVLPALPVRWGGDSQSTEGEAMAPLPCLGVGRPGSRAWKTPHLSTWIRQTCTPLSSLVRLCYRLGSADKQSCCLGLLLGHCRKELTLPRSEGWLLQAPP